MGFINGGGGNGASADDNINSFVRNGVSYEVAVKVSQNGAISFDDYASSGNYFKGIDFSGYGNISDEEPVNFFGKSDEKVFHNRFKEQYNRFKDTGGDGIFRVYGHGNKRMIWNEDQMIYDAADFDKAMAAKNPRWLQVDHMKNAMLFLYSCESAVENEHGESIGRKISRQHPKVTVIGFEGYVDYSSALPGMSRVNKDRYTGDGKGYMVVYKNGRVMFKTLYKDL